MKVASTEKMIQDDLFDSPGSPEYKKLRTADHMCGYLEKQKSQVS
jgi:hypothetical protein